jgi:hypothetical protein
METDLAEADYRLTGKPSDAWVRSQVRPPTPEESEAMGDIREVLDSLMDEIDDARRDQLEIRRVRVTALAIPVQFLLFASW